MLFKKIILAAAFFCSASLFAEDQSSGCGAGWMLFKDNSIVSSYFRSITNAVASNTFAMTSGTSGCAKHSIVQADKRSLHFIDANYQKLVTDFAVGQGESLAAFADTLGCSPQGALRLGKTLQENFDTIVDSNLDQKPEDLLINVRSQIYNQPALLHSCLSA